jgi:hypothetical protein
VKLGDRPPGGKEWEAAVAREFDVKAEWLPAIDALRITLPSRPARTLLVTPTVTDGKISQLTLRNYDFIIRPVFR